ncbi:PREDICTED: UPF0496 protein At3g19330-like isoform X2 [Tarenaya hassleriana]|uniref:UPF0496 protein At3g19330-like isoform X2 n=1 Tax=Tarenaya hassleriana TaxID=28532 RepID=UPI00053C7E20|nr:PREDICTED: UPF0496 protein At3g19330-like isoform X2 [Tarenaya hassleriana]
MLQCLSFKAASSGPINGDPLPQTSPANSATSTTVNLSRELAHALQTHSYNEMRSLFHESDPTLDHLQFQQDDGDRTELLLSQVLQPNRECVEEALSHAKQTSLTQLISTYFQHSEDATSLCLNLYQSVHSARELYRPLFDLLDILPIDPHAINESHCNLAFDIFLKFDSLDNPFPCPESHNFRETQQCFSLLKQQLDTRLRKSRTRVRLLHRATAGPLCSAYLPHSFKKKELANISQLNAAAKGTFVLNKDLDTIDRLVSRLHMGIENDKLFVRLGLERGRDIYPIQEIVKQLRKSHLNVTHQLKDLEDHICLWFTNVNKARSLLLQEIHLHRTYSS